MCARAAVQLVFAHASSNISPPGASSPMKAKPATSSAKPNENTINAPPARASVSHREFMRRDSLKNLKNFSAISRPRNPANVKV